MIWCTPSHASQIKSASQSWWLTQLVTQQPCVLLGCKDKVVAEWKKSPKYSGLSYHPSSASDYHWSQNLGSDKPCILNLSAQRYESLSEPCKSGVRGNYEERNEFHRGPKVKGTFGFQAGMRAGWSNSLQHLWSTLATFCHLLYSSRLA